MMIEHALFIPVIYFEIQFKYFYFHIAQFLKSQIRFYVYGSFLTQQVEREVLYEKTLPLSKIIFQ